jgi:hypothetical protein
MPDDVLARLQRLEHDYRRLKRAVLALVATVLAAYVMGVAQAAPNIPEEIVARSFRVVGKNGENSAILAATDDGFVGLFFRDLKNRLRYTVLTTPAGDTTTSYTDGTTSRLEVGAIVDTSSKDYSLRLVATDHSTIWKPPLRNEIAPATAH